MSVGRASDRGRRNRTVAATQEALYQAHDLELSWSEASLPERERTKHVHRLHPYLGKFIPQLVEALLDRHVPAGGRVLDPFAGSGTTLVQALESGLRRDRRRHRRASTRCSSASRRARTTSRRCAATCSGPTPRRRRSSRADAIRARRRRTCAPGSRRLRPRSCCTSARSSSRSARPTCCGSCSPARPARRGGRRTSTSSSRASRSSSRTGATSTGASAGRSSRPAGSCCATRSTRSSGSRRSRPPGPTGCVARVLHGDARAIDLEGPYDGVITSPPYPGLIDYHEQHRYAYELLGVDERRDLELGRPARGTGRAAIEEYVDGVARGARERPLVARRSAGACASSSTTAATSIPRSCGGPGLRLVDRHERHVNRRTGRRAGEYYESILVAVAPESATTVSRHTLGSTLGADTCTVARTVGWCARARPHLRRRRPRAAPRGGRGAPRLGRPARVLDRRARRPRLPGGEAPRAQRHRQRDAAVARPQPDHRQPRAGGVAQGGIGLRPADRARAARRARTSSRRSGCSSTAVSASSRSTAACVRSRARSPSPRARGAQG